MMRDAVKPILDRKVIAIVGGSRGIGGELIDTLRDEFLISTCSRTIEREEIDTFLSRRYDVRQSRNVKDFVLKTMEKFGRIDILIYNVGVMLFDDLAVTAECDLNAMYQSSVKGFMLMCQEVLPIMKEQRSGHIIYISSTRGITSAPGKAGYSAMKQAAKSLVDSIIIENKKYRIKATSICPGIVDTESSREKYGKKLSKLNPIEEKDVAKTVLFLLSLSQNAHVNSIIIGGKL